MARIRQYTEVVSDDLDGSTKNVETISFAIEGQSYEIDLGPKNAKELRKQFATWAQAGRKVRTARKPSSGRRRSAAKTSGSESGAIREWAAANGIEISSRGRIPATVIEQYKAAR